jgi:hypothetical protein
MSSMARLGHTQTSRCRTALRTLQLTGELGIAHAAHALLFDSPAAELWC